MRKFTQNLLLLTAASLFIFSCGEDEEPTALAPSITVTAAVDGTAISSGDPVLVGSVVDITVVINAPGGVNGLDINGTSLNRTELNADAGDTEATYTFPTPAIAVGDLGSTLVYAISAVDDLGQESATTTFEITPASPAVNSYSAFLLGGFQNSTTGSFYNAVENIVYTSSDALMNDEKVDLLFYYSDVAQYTIAALDNAEADATIESQTGGDLDNFDPQNPTRFKTFLTAPDFDAVATIADLEDAYAGDADLSGESRITMLEAGDVFGFVLSSDRGEKLGLIEVVATSGSSGSDRAIEIEVKIEP